ncbi:MAG: hypothetical protein Q9217_001356 [Psora testacea]
MPATDSPPQAEQHSPDSASKPQYKPLDLSGTWWSRQLNALNFATGRLSAEDGARFLQREEIKRWATSLKDCEKRRQYLLKYSPIVRFMTEKVDGLGANITSKHFACNFCVEMKAGGFNPDYGMELCANKLTSRRHQEQVMAHELMHAYDHMRFEVDWNDLRHAACSEIRASGLSGECGFVQQFWRHGQHKITRGYQDCVKRRAILSMVARPNCKDELQAAKVVNEVWDSCLTDTRPFDEVYK